MKSLSLRKLYREKEGDGCEEVIQTLGFDSLGFDFSALYPVRRRLWVSAISQVPALRATQLRLRFFLSLLIWLLPSCRLDAALADI